MLTDTTNSLNAPTEVVKQIIINIEAGVEVEVTIAAQNEKIKELNQGVSFIYIDWDADVAG